jgi:3D (Asp-Asp-Asp) domain-containing protein
MPFLVTALVGFLVLPASVVAPIPASAAYSAPEIVVKKAPVSSAKTGILPVLTVKLTAYNALPAQTDKNPFATASGAFSNPEVVIARSQDLASTLPFGTVIELSRSGLDTPSCNYSKVKDLIGYRVVADSMNARITNTVDVLLDQNDTVLFNGRQLNPGIVLGRCGEVTARVVGHVKIQDIPATQKELATLFAPTAIAKR